MSNFLEKEKVNQTAFKKLSPYISDAARADGFYKGKSRSFCLPVECAEENLFPSTRKMALGYFDSNNIRWHDGYNSKPSNHLCDSQVCCVNFLFPFSDKPNALATVLHPVFPHLKKMLPVEEGHYVAFEWIGLENYLCEKNSRKGSRSRGANFTSADAIVMFERKDGKRQIALIEWKYTESYHRSSLKITKRGTNRTDIYRPFFERNNCPLNRELLPDFEALFYEPFYQLMRQQFLAHEMEVAKEMGAEKVCVLHIVPDHNAVPPIE